MSFMHKPQILTISFDHATIHSLSLCENKEKYKFLTSRKYTTLQCQCLPSDKLCCEIHKCSIYFDLELNRVALSITDAPPTSSTSLPDKKKQGPKRHQPWPSSQSFSSYSSQFQPFGAIQVFSEIFGSI